MKNIITLKNIKKSYGTQNVLDGFSATIDESCAFMGVSGKGKTTLLRMIAGLERADSGELSFERRPVFSVVFQEDRLFEDFSGVTNITAVIGRGAEREACARATLKALLIPEDEHDKPVYTYSGGMKRRVALARALLAPSDIILLDEPYKGLDESTRAVVCEVVKEYTKDKLTILVTHDAEEAELCGIDRILEI